MKYGSLESLRGVAALGVVLFHSGFVVQTRGAVLENASLFVDFFFILSGFVMAHAYRARIEDGFGLREFVILRLGRLYPVHLFCLGLWLAYLLVMIPWGDAALEHHLQGVLPHLLMLNSVGLQGHLSLNYPAWSVGAEFWTCILFFAAAAALRHRLTTAVAIGIALICYAVLVAQGQGTLQWTHDFGLLRCLGGFFLGVALQSVRARREWSGHRTRGEVLAVALIVVLLAQPAGSLAVEAATIAGFTWLVWVFAGSDGAVADVLQMRVPAFVGRISYSIYMLQALILIVLMGSAELGPLSGAFQGVVLDHPVYGPEYFLQTVYAPWINAAAVLLVIGVAALVYRVIEEPCRRASRRWVADASRAPGVAQRA